jgi:hypothetical protein
MFQTAASDGLSFMAWRSKIEPPMNRLIGVQRLLLLAFRG